MAPDQMSFYLSQTEVDRCRRIPSRCCSKDSGKSQGIPEFRLPLSWGSDSLLHLIIRPYLSRQDLLGCWALVPQILDCGLSLPCLLLRFKHHLSLIRPGYVSPAHTSLLNPEYAPHLPAWRHHVICPHGRILGASHQGRGMSPSCVCPSQQLPAVSHGCVKNNANGCRA